MPTLHAHYTPPLGGIHTPLSYPLLSYHMHVPEEDRKKMHITGASSFLQLSAKDRKSAVLSIILNLLHVLELFHIRI